MSRFCCADHRCDTGRFARRTAQAATLFVLVSALLVAGEIDAAATLRIAVAPFAGEVDALAIAQHLAGELAERDLERLIRPGDFVAENTFEPRAADVRRWAYNSAVDAIVVGRVYSIGKVEHQTRVIETIVRSGHSGAELSRHEVSLASGSEIGSALETLAASILAGLGYRERPSDSHVPGGGNLDQGGQSPGSGPAGAQRTTAEGSEQGLDLGFSQSGFRGDAPIEIKAEEAEIINRDEGRQLIFQRNVMVRQANVSLRSDRLEALYRSGESEPHELRAEGHVSIDQGDRRAKCDRAIYQRETQVLICRGHAELVQGCDVVRGEVIEIDLAGDHARVEGAASILIRSESPGEGEGDVSAECGPAEGSL
jgi:lipopolysaccharide export system protein LptA